MKHEVNCEVSEGLSQNCTCPVPDRLCSEKVSEFFDEEILPKVDVWIDGNKQDGRVVEYCVTKRWARVYKHDGDGSLIIRNGEAQIKMLRDRDIVVKWKS